MTKDLCRSLSQCLKMPLYIREQQFKRAAMMIMRHDPSGDPLPEEASSQAKMAYKLRTALGKAISGARKYTVEPVIGIIKEV